MSDKITCPQCQYEMEVSEVMAEQIAAGIRADLEKDLADKNKRLAQERQELASTRKEIEARQEELDEQIRAGLDKERKKILARARKEAEQALAVELKDRDAQVADYRKQLDDAQKNELELRKQQRELEEKSKAQELEVARKLDEERKSIADAAMKRAQEESRLKQAEKEQVIDGLRKQIDDLKRKAEQGSQQTQGEVQEIELENLLVETFPTDSIEPVPKGVKGGDVIQRVRDASGRECGVILWESKRTKNWSDGWLGKLRDDQQEAKASCTCIVSAVVPDSITHFGEIDGVWVSTWPCAASAALALRTALIAAARSELALEGRQDKMEMVYNYLAGPEFRNRVGGLAEAFMSLQGDLDAEKRAFQKQWNKREKQLQRAMISTTGLWGDLQGIIGSSLQEIEGMELLALESEE